MHRAIATEALAGADVEGALELLTRLLDRASQISLRTLRRRIAGREG